MSVTAKIEPTKPRLSGAVSGQFGLRWIAVATHTHKEAVAVENLHRQGFEVYLPRIRKTVRHARRSHEVLRPFFPGYAFASIDPEGGQRWQAIYSTFGVRTIVGSAGRPSALDAAFIASLKAREIDGAIVKPVAQYRIGQEVQLTAGAFDGLVASIVAMDEKQRLVVLLDLLNQSVRVHTDIHGVREL